MIRAVYRPSSHKEVARKYFTQTEIVSIQPSAVSRQPCGTGFGLWPRCANDAVR
ncbi:MAG: hypothetical protein F6J90_36590 [Moorea sp. SIOASIH]|uniref:hypothetical protein n=1 Tax=Moorena sp. SIOASIH TaxID=2607817 RepID=UPI0013BE3965|nr:hypothetical protein [Moorena sp. SIOASIH]NEO41554.1 hypothetical protein [Moorena sp. SIOASIH]